jgi:hypothetical protein
MIRRLEMRKTIAVFLAFSLFWLLGTLYAEKKGAELVIEKKDSWYERGELIAVKQDSLLLLDSAGTDVSVDIGNIKTIKITKNSKAVLGAGIGFLIGAAIGVSALASENSKSQGGWFSIEFPSYYGAVLGLPTALVGAIIGAAAGSDETIQIEGKSDSDIKKILEDLSNKARVTHFQ